MNRISRPYKNKLLYSYASAVPPIGQPTGTPAPGAQTSHGLSYLIAQEIKKKGVWKWLNDIIFGERLTDEELTQLVNEAEAERNRTAQAITSNLFGGGGRPYQGGGSGVDATLRLPNLLLPWIPQASGATGSGCGTQNGCNEACYKLGNSRYGSGKYRMSPKQTGCRNCQCNFVKCGTQNGCNEACYKLGNSRYGSGKYRMSPKQSSCTSCKCNFTKCGTQNGCNEACYKLGNSRYGSGKYRMSPKQTSCTNCNCNFVRCGTQSGCQRACPSKSGYTKNPRQVNCTTCYCNYKKIAFRCPYSGCSGTGSSSQCFLCRCRGICNNARCGGVRTVRSNGSCFCNKSC